MRGGFGKLLCFVAAVSSSGAVAMSAHGSARVSCTVVGAEKLPPTVGTELICNEIGRAMARAAPSAHYSVEVRVLSPSRLSAVLTVDGRRLEEQNLAVSDRDLAAGPIRRFAETIAAAAAKH